MKAVIVVKEVLDNKLSSVLEQIYKSLKVIHSGEDVISLIYSDPPDIIIIDGTYLLNKETEIIQEFKSNTIYGHLPMVAIMKSDDMREEYWQDVPIDDFIIVDDNELTIKRRLEFITKRSIRELNTNPLTRLPGNEAIIRYIQDMFDQGKEIAIAWVDIDNFKPFNDRYGFSRGDEVLLATARIISNAIKELKKEETFVGHIGGDDFVYICPIASARALCEDVISRFDMIIKNFYNDEDLEQGCIISRSRSGEVMKFPIMSISISVVLNEKKRYSHYGQVSQDATEIKKYVKSIEGSNFMIDRRGRN